MKAVCEVCGKEYTAKRTPTSGHFFCSKECRHAHYYVTLTCDVCGCSFDRLKCAVKEGTRNHVCSPGCFKTYRQMHMASLNKTLNPSRMTDEVKEKLRNARLNRGEGKTYTKSYGRHTHRIVAEQMLGRKLAKGEVVHHIDGNKRNNDPSNLMVFASQAEHAKYHKEHPYEVHAT